MNKRKLFIGNLNYSVTEGQIRKLLSPHGDVVGVKLMEGKGYAFVEMGTEEQAEMIQQTLSESVFEGRKLLIDGVPGKHKPGIKQDYHPPDSPGARSARTPPRNVEPGIHHLEAIERPPKPEGKKREPIAKNRISGKPSQMGKAPERSGKTIQEQRSPVETPHKVNKNPHPEPNVQPFPQESGNSKKPAEPEKSQKPYTKKPYKPGKTSKPEKAKPPKNPHPYQGSKKSKKPQNMSTEAEKTSDDSPDTEKKDYLRYWATRAGKNQ